MVTSAYIKTPLVGAILPPSPTEAVKIYFEVILVGTYISSLVQVKKIIRKDISVGFSLLNF